MRSYVVAAVIVGIGIAGYFLYFKSETEAPIVAASGTATDAAMVEVVIPELAGNEVIGERIFNAKCAACHGTNAAGKEGAGPPFINQIYRPSHHGDQAFLLAPRNGVNAHHWRFGNMPKVEGITDAEVKMVVSYVRALQRANGIQ